MSKQRVFSKLFAVMLLLGAIGIYSLSPTTLVYAQDAPDQGTLPVPSDCEAALPLSDSAQIKSQDLSAGSNWMRIDVQQGQRYTLRFAADSDNMAFTISDDCHANGSEYQARDGELTFIADKDGALYVQLQPVAAQLAEGVLVQADFQELGADPPNKVSLSEAPLDLQRRAIDLLEEVRGDPDSLDWQNARLRDEVRLLYRPDMTEIAYYEFLVEKPGELAYEPAGFIQLSSADHDYVVTNWSPIGLSPTQELDELAPINSTVATQYYKLDVLSFVAEQAEPTPLGFSVAISDVLQLGEMPPRYVGFDTLPLDYEPSTVEYIWHWEDTGTGTYTPTLEIIGEEEPAFLSEEEWENWSTLKAEYAEVYAPILEGIKNDASEEWSDLQSINDSGVALLLGEHVDIRALPSYTLQDIVVTGSGSDAQYVQQDSLDYEGLPQGVKLTIVGEPEQAYEELPLNVVLQYSNGISETRRYVIINSASLIAPNTVYLPQVNANGEPQSLVTSAESSADDAGATGLGSNPPDWWADGTNRDKPGPSYNQIPPNTRVNNNPCHSGCVPTAWAMLFAWADQRAAVPNSGWNHLWGIYRQNGGYGVDAVAPQRESDDRGIENVMMELRTHLGTKCSGTSGETDWDQGHRAALYLKNRAETPIRVLNAKGWWIFGTSVEDTTNRAISVIKGGEPVVISTWGHAPLAVGYQEYTKRVRKCFIWCWYETKREHEFFINQGWGGSSNQWINAKTRVAGDIQTHR